MAVEYLFIDDPGDDLMHPFAALQLIVWNITAGKLEFEVEYCKQMNRDYWCCKILNFMIVILTLPLVIAFCPFYSIAVMDILVYVQFIKL